MRLESMTLEALAIDGGQPVRNRPFPPWPLFDEEQIETVSTVLRSGKVNYWTGQEGREFEREFAGFVGSKHAIALANGTLALELALYALGIQPGDEVIVPCRTFIASASCVAMRGAIPVLADVDPISQNLTVETIEPLLTSRTRAIIAVHLAGWPCDMDSIMELASARGLKVIEDCAQAHGATYKGRPVGSLGDAGAFSFCQDKIVTTGGEGGILTTNSEDVKDLAWSYKDHGKSWKAINGPGPANVFRYVHESFGSNLRLTEMQSAIGRLALRQLPAWVARRRRHAAILFDRFSRIPGLTLSIPPTEIGHSYYKFYAFVEPQALRADWTRDRIASALQAEGIVAGSGICPEIYREKAFSSRGWGPEQPYATARRLGETSLMFQVHPTLRDEDMFDIANATAKVMRAATTSESISIRKAA